MAALITSHLAPLHSCSSAKGMPKRMPKGIPKAIPKCAAVGVLGVQLYGMLMQLLRVSATPAGGSLHAAEAVVRRVELGGRVHLQADQDKGHPDQLHLPAQGAAHTHSPRSKYRLSSSMMALITS